MILIFNMIVNDVSPIVTSINIALIFFFLADDIPKFGGLAKLDFEQLDKRFASVSFFFLDCSTLFS